MSIIRNVRYAKCPLFEMSVYELSVYEMSAYEMSAYEMSANRRLYIKLLEIQCGTRIQNSNDDLTWFKEVIGYFNS